MQQRIQPLISRQIGFAHRGARAHAPENTLEAFQLALRLGSNGLESDVWITKDGHLVLDHDGVVRQRLRSRPISSFNRQDLPVWIPTVEEMLEACGSKFHLSLDIKDVSTMHVLINKIGNHEIAERTWLCHPDLQLIEQWAGRTGKIRLVHSTRLHAMKLGPERHAAVLAELGVACVNMPFSDWNGGLVALFHRFNVLCFGWNLQFPEVIQTGLRMGLDGVFSDWPDRLSDQLSILHQ